MNRYLVQYSTSDGWVPFIVESDSIYEVETWVKANIAESGTCITNLY